MGEHVKPVVLKNRNGKNLFGILHTPPEAARNIGIIILSPGIKSRVGPHRLYVKMTELFTRMGFTVLRADPEGLGDSEGEIDQYVTADIYGSIELGLLVSDTLDMMDWMARETGLSSFILTGLCGGAISALLASENAPRVKGILSLGMTCILASDKIDPAKYMTTKQLSGIRERYLKKVFSIDAWKRFLSFQSDYRLLFKSLAKPFLKKVAPAALAPANAAGPASSGPPATNLNPKFHRAFAGFVRQNKLLLIFSEADRLYWEFEEKYLGVHAKDIEPYRQNFRIEVVKDANHVFSFTQWQQQMLDLSKRWLETYFKKA
jgi:hypothetical protein